MAQASLTAELLVCKVSGISPKQWHVYLGRAQYPKFKVKPLVRRNQDGYKYACPHMLYWGGARTLLRLFQHVVPLPVPLTAPTEKLAESLSTFFSTSTSHAEELPSELAAHVPLFCWEVFSLRMKVRQLI